MQHQEISEMGTSSPRHCTGPRVGKQHFWGARERSDLVGCLFCLLLESGEVVGAKPGSRTHANQFYLEQQQHGPSKPCPCLRWLLCLWWRRPVQATCAEGIGDLFRFCPQVTTTAAAAEGVGGQQLWQAGSAGMCTAQLPWPLIQKELFLLYSGFISFYLRNCKNYLHRYEV